MWKLNHWEVGCEHKTKKYNILIWLEVLIVRTNEYIRCDYLHNELLFWAIFISVFISSKSFL